MPPHKGGAMNKNQKAVLIAMIAVIVMMLLYPPFHLHYKNGVVLNMGYGWIFEPPKRGVIEATVNVPMLLVQWMGVLLVGGLGLFLTKDSTRPHDSSPSTSKNEDRRADPLPENFAQPRAQVQTVAGPQGVGGWLLLLVAGMMVLGPLLGAGRISAEFMAAEVQYPTLASMEQWRTYKAGTWWIFLLVAATSFYGGWGLAKETNYSAVMRAKAILWITGPGATLVMGLLLPAMIFGATNALNAQFAVQFIGTVIAAAVWTTYLTRSKRVRNTYGTHGIT